MKSEKTIETVTVGSDGYVSYAKIIKHDKDIAEKWSEWYNENAKIVQHKGKAEQMVTDTIYKEGFIKYYEKNT